MSRETALLSIKTNDATDTQGNVHNITLKFFTQLFKLKKGRC